MMLTRYVLAAERELAAALALRRQMADDLASTTAVAIVRHGEAERVHVGGIPYELDLPRPPPPCPIPLNRAERRRARRDSRR